MTHSAGFMKALALIGSLVTLVLSVEFMRKEKIAGFEFPILVLLATLGMMMLISASDFIALYLGLELMSLSLYVVAAYHRDNARASEAGLKYFVLGALSSGMLLYGASLIYGFAGTVSFTGVAVAIHGQASIGIVFGLVFLLAGLAFKISAVPFHMWTPDVYEGAPTPVTAFFASGPKMAAMAVLVRVVTTAFPGVEGEWRQVIVFISIASMALGSFAAIGQTSFKRLMAYSSIGHMGFALVGLAAGTAEGVHGVVVYMSIYLLMTLGTFAAHSVDAARRPLCREYLRSRRPCANQRADGFFSRRDDVFAGGHSAAGRILRQILCLRRSDPGQSFCAGGDRRACSVVGAFYYLRIVKIMYFDEPAKAFDQAGIAARVVLALSTALVIFYAIAPAPLTDAAMAAAKSLF